MSESEIDSNLLQQRKSLETIETMYNNRKCKHDIDHKLMTNRKEIDKQQVYIKYAPNKIWIRKHQQRIQMYEKERKTLRQTKQTLFLPFIDVHFIPDLANIILAYLN